MEAIMQKLERSEADVRAETRALKAIIKDNEKKTITTLTLLDLRLKAVLDILSKPATSPIQAMSQKRHHDDISASDEMNGMSFKF